MESTTSAPPVRRVVMRTEKRGSPASMGGGRFLGERASRPFSPWTGGTPVPPFGARLTAGATGGTVAALSEELPSALSSASGRRHAELFTAPS